VDKEIDEILDAEPQKTGIIPMLLATARKKAEKIVMMKKLLSKMFENPFSGRQHCVKSFILFLIFLTLTTKSSTS